MAAIKWKYVQIRDFFLFFCSPCYIDKCATLASSIILCTTNVRSQRQCHIFSLSQSRSFTKTLFICSSLWLKLWFICGFRYLNASVQPKHDKHLRSSHLPQPLTCCALLPKNFTCGLSCVAPLCYLLNMIYPNWSINSFAFTNRNCMRHDEHKCEFSPEHKHIVYDSVEKMDISYHGQKLNFYFIYVRIFWLWLFTRASYLFVPLFGANVIELDGEGLIKRSGFYMETNAVGLEIFQWHWIMTIKTSTIELL